MGIFLDAREQSAVLQPRSVKVVGQRAKLVGTTFSQGFTIGEDITHVPVLVIEHLAGAVDIKLHNHEILDRAIVERSGDPALSQARA